MSLRDEILKEYSKFHTNYLAKKIGPDQEAFDELIDLLLHGDLVEMQRAAWIMSHCLDDHPWLVEKHLESLILNLQNDIDVVVKRNTVRVLQFVDIPEDLLGNAAEICFSFLNSGKEPVAVRAHAMTILYNIVKKYPELKEELKLSIEEQLPFGSAGIKNRGSKILKALENL
jgi:hypothetical protein